MRHSTIPKLALPLLLLLAGLGCQGAGGPSSETYGSVDWVDTDTESPVPGLDHAILRWFFTGDRLMYVVWTDLEGREGSSSGSGGGRSQGLEEHEAHIETGSGERFEYGYRRSLEGGETPDRGEIVVGDEPFSLAEGALVLVSTQAGRTRIAQTKVPPALVSLLHDPSQTRDSLRVALRAFAREHLPIRRFYELHRVDQVPRVEQRISGPNFGATLRRYDWLPPGHDPLPPREEGEGDVFLRDQLWFPNPFSSLEVFVVVAEPRDFELEIRVAGPTPGERFAFSGLEAGVYHLKFDDPGSSRYRATVRLLLDDEVVDELETRY